MEAIRKLASALMVAIVILQLHGDPYAEFRKEPGNRGAGNNSFTKEPNSKGSDLICNPDIIARFYGKAGKYLTPQWGSTDKISQMLSVIRHSSDDGLNPEDYHLSDIEKLVEKIVTEGTSVEGDADRFEQLLTDAFFLLSAHLSAGKTDPETTGNQWDVSRRQTGMEGDRFLDSLLNKTGNIAEALRNMAPGNPDYLNLKKALARYRRIEADGGWGSFNPGISKLEPGMRSPDVKLLRKRLDIPHGSIKYALGDSDLFDRNLYEQVIKFQQQNGLEPDGIVGKSTIEALNITVGRRIEEIEANLERWRWTKEDLGKRYILVNLADCSLKVIENDSVAFRSKAIVGKPDKKTPVFSSVMRYIVLNPEWVIPPGILKDEIIPAMIKDSSYLARHNMKIYDREGNIVEAAAIDLAELSPADFRYTIRQEPGRNNPLGDIKFIFPNPFSVYIHDTPSKSLFQRSKRIFSHGCIRIDRAHELAQFLLRDNPEWDPGQIKKAIDSQKEKIIILPEPIPVHILYLTAQADNEGNAYFSRDIYDRDRLLISALKQTPMHDQLARDSANIPGIPAEISEGSLNKF